MFNQNLLLMHLVYSSWHELWKYAPYISVISFFLLIIYKFSGFISIDCGSIEDYTDPTTGIWYQTDKDFVESGINHRISSDVSFKNPYYEPLLRTLRSFPEGDRNCYTLKPQQGKNNNYLIRAIFSYQN